MRYHLDEHIHHAIAIGLRRRSIDVTTTVEAGLKGASDERQLAYARAAGRVIITFDDDFLALARRGTSHAGILYCAQRSRTIARVIEFALLVDACLTPEQMRNHVEFC